MDHMDQHMDHMFKLNESPQYNLEYQVLIFCRYVTVVCKWLGLFYPHHLHYFTKLHFMTNAHKVFVKLQVFFYQNRFSVFSQYVKKSFLYLRHKMKIKQSNGMAKIYLSMVKKCALPTYPMPY